MTSALETRSVYRILDAAANRCREGLRVLEDYVRFLKDEPELSARLKSLRHRLQATLAELPAVQILSARDTPGDVGTKITLASEQHRTSLSDLLQANCKRIAEALRSLEEYSKLLAPAIAATLEGLRYEFYDFEKHLLRELPSSRGGKLRDQLQRETLYLLLTEENCCQNWEETLKQAISGGVGIVQLREKTASDRELLQKARQVREWTTEAGVLLIINDRPDIALLCDADGVHVGQDELPVQEVRQLIGPDKLIGLSTHSVEQALEAETVGADYLGVGPVFPSQTKTFTEFPGLKLVEAVAKKATLPWFPIGGIQPDNASLLKTAGATRIAISQAICQAEFPAEIACQFAKKFPKVGTNTLGSAS